MDDKCIEVAIEITKFIMEKEIDIKEIDIREIVEDIKK